MVIVLFPYADTSKLSGKVIAHEHCLHVVGTYTLLLGETITQTNVAPLEVNAKIPLPPQAETTHIQASSTPGGLVVTLPLRAAQEENTIIFDHFSGSLEF